MLVGEERGSFRDVRESKRVDAFESMSDEELRQFVYGTAKSVTHLHRRLSLTLVSSSDCPVCEARRFAAAALAQ